MVKYSSREGFPIYIYIIYNKVSLKPFESIRIQKSLERNETETCKSISSLIVNFVLFKIDWQSILIIWHLDPLQSFLQMGGIFIALKLAFLSVICMTGNEFWKEKLYYVARSHSQVYVMKWDKIDLDEEKKDGLIISTRMYFLDIKYKLFPLSMLPFR